MALASLSQAFQVQYRFTERPVAVAGDLRPLWRFASICLILSRCRRRTATLKQLHVLSWAIRDQASRESFLGMLQNKPAVFPIVRIEPSLNRAISLALGERLILRRSTDSSVRVELSARGATFTKLIDETPEIFTEEKRFFSALDQKVSAVAIDRILQWNSVL